MGEEVNLNTASDVGLTHDNLKYNNRVIPKTQCFKNIHVYIYADIIDKI